MADAQTIAVYATAGGTLVLAIATFAAVRSANRSARTAERAFQIGLQPLLFPSRLEDAELKIRWGDDHWAHLGGGRAVVERSGDVIYLALSVRNVGSGIAVLQSWRPQIFPPFGSAPVTMPELGDFSALSRDLYVPAGDISFWQAAIRDTADSRWGEVLGAIDRREHLIVDLLYTDYEGGQRTISRFLLSPGSQERGDWLGSVVKHWNLDRPDPHA